MPSRSRNARNGIPRLSSLLSRLEVTGTSPAGVPLDIPDLTRIRRTFVYTSISNEIMSISDEMNSISDQITSIEQRHSPEAVSSDIASNNDNDDHEDDEIVNSNADDDSYDDNSRNASNDRWWSYADYESGLRGTSDPSSSDNSDDEEDEDTRSSYQPTETTTHQAFSAQELEDHKARISARKFVQQLEAVEADVAASEECAICRSSLADYSEGDGIAVQMPCHTSHVFHRECIYTWMVQHPSCPSCRATFSYLRSETLSRAFEELDDSVWGRTQLRYRG